MDTSHEHTDAQLLVQLRLEVEQAIHNYEYKVPDSAIGNPLSKGAIADGLASMRASLVKPYWSRVEVRDTIEQIGIKEGPQCDCVVVADNQKGFVLLFDPDQNSFALAQRGETGLTTFGVRGDAVGCFLAI